MQNATFAPCQAASASRASHDKQPNAQLSHRLHAGPCLSKVAGPLPLGHSRSYTPSDLAMVVAMAIALETTSIRPAALRHLQRGRAAIRRFRCVGARSGPPLLGSSTIRWLDPAPTVRCCHCSAAHRCCGSPTIRFSHPSSGIPEGETSHSVQALLPCARLSRR